MSLLQISKELSGLNYLLVAYGCLWLPKHGLDMLLTFFSPPICLVRYIEVALVSCLLALFIFALLEAACNGILLGKTESQKKED